MSGEAPGKSKKRPAFQFYPKEWIWDLELRQCSIAARGLWADLLCMMHEAKPYGALTHPVNLVLQITGLTWAEYDALVLELESHHVFSRMGDGTIYSRRMVRDEEKRNSSAINGKLGGNPSLVKGGVNPDVADSGISAPEEKRRRNNKDSYTDLTPDFIALYPSHRRDNLGVQLFMGEKDQAGIVERLRGAVASDEWTKDGGKYVPKASKWLTEGAPGPAAVAPAKVEYFKPGSISGEVTYGH